MAVIQRDGNGILSELVLVAMARDVAGALYFHIGLRFINIFGVLAINHRIVISMRTLKRPLCLQHLFQRRHYTKVSPTHYQHVYRWYN